MPPDIQHTMLLKAAEQSCYNSNKYTFQGGVAIVRMLEWPEIKLLYGS